MLDGIINTKYRNIDFTRHTVKRLLCYPLRYSIICSFKQFMMGELHLIQMLM